MDYMDRMDGMQNSLSISSIKSIASMKNQAARSSSRFPFCAAYEPVSKDWEPPTIVFPSIGKSRDNFPKSWKPRPAKLGTQGNVVALTASRNRICETKVISLANADLWWEITSVRSN